MLSRHLSCDRRQALSGKIFTGLMTVSETRKLLADHALIEGLRERRLNPYYLSALLSGPGTAGLIIRAAQSDVAEVPAALTFQAFPHGIRRRAGRGLMQTVS